jgi:hypothetical protein
MIFYVNCIIELMYSYILLTVQLLGHEPITIAAEFKVLCRVVTVIFIFVI